MQGSREVTIKTLNIRRTAGILAAVCVLAACANGMNSGEADISTMKPRLTSLYTGDTAVSLTPIFYWAEVSGATSYDLYLSTDSTAGATPYIAGIKIPPYALSPALSSATLYYWKVIARNANSQSLPSNIQSFTTKKAPGFAAPAYSSPANGSTLYPVAGFSWNTVAAATNYRFLCSTSTDASGRISWDKTTATSETASGIFFNPGYTWYWKVVAEDATTCSDDTSAVWSFTPKSDGIAAPANIAIDMTSYAITWDAVTGASKYFVLLNYGGAAFTQTSLGYAVTSATSFSASFLSPGKTIGYTVVAIDTSGNTSYTASVAAAKTFVR